MWIMTRHGFISVVATDEHESYDLQVRARDEQTLRDIRDGYSWGGEISEIVALPNRDYQYRFYTTRRAFGAVLDGMADEITYPNFKDTLRGKLHDLASELWWVIWQHYQPQPMRRRKERAETRRFPVVDEQQWDPDDPDVAPWDDDDGPYEDGFDALPVAPPTARGGA